MPWYPFKFLTLPAVNIAVNKNDIYRVRYYFSRAHVIIFWSLWYHQQSIVTLSAECKPSEWDTGTIRSSFLTSFTDSLCRARNKIMHVLSGRTVYVLTICCCATREINTKINLSWTHKGFATRVYILFYISSFLLACTWQCAWWTIFCILRVFTQMTWSKKKTWRYDIGTLSALLILCDGNPPVTGWCPSQRVCNADL